MTNYTTKILFVIILLLAGFFRFWQIAALPGGLFPDEAANGLDVNSILEGDLKPFYERGNGREAMFFYFLAASVAAFGRGAWQHHIVSAGFGFFAVVAAYFLTKRLFDERVALLASFFMAVSSYAVTITRTAFRATTVPLLTTLTLLFLVKAVQAKDSRSRWRNALLSGACFGLGFYTYLSFRMMVPLLAAAGVILAISYRSSMGIVWKQYRAALGAFALAFVITFAPLGYYFITHPGTFVGRAGQVSIFSEDLNQGDVAGTFLLVFKKTMFSFFADGDLNWRHNVSGYPFLSPFVSPFFAAGLLVFTLSILYGLRARARSGKSLSMALVALWFWLMLVPEITTAEGIPHGPRLIGVIPAIFIIPAWAASWLWDKLKAMEWMYNFKWVLAIVFFASIFFYNFILYFHVAASSPDYYYAFRSDLSVVSNYLNERSNRAQTFLSLDKFSVQTVSYLTTDARNPYVLLDPARTYEVRLKSGDQVIFTQSTIFDRRKFVEYHPETKLIRSDKNQFGEYIMLVYQQP